MTDHHHNIADKATTNAEAKAPTSGAPHRHGGHGLMMIACCIPMLAIAVVLVVTGVASVGFLLFAVACTAMMALMMRGMHGGGPGESVDQEHPARSTDPRYK